MAMDIAPTVRIPGKFFFGTTVEFESDQFGTHQAFTAETWVHCEKFPEKFRICLNELS
ncbi:MAG: hypothetical protein ACXWKP_11135 [Bradyrhizobium sp.]